MSQEKLKEAMDPFGTKYCVLDEGQEFFYKSAVNAPRNDKRFGGSPMSILWG